MGLFDRVERRLERAVNGAFARAFKAEVQPVEIASAMRRAMDDRAAVVGHGRTIVPNLFTVELGPTDYEPARRLRRRALGRARGHRAGARRVAALPARRPGRGQLRPARRPRDRRLPGAHRHRAARRGAGRHAGRAAAAPPAPAREHRPAPPAAVPAQPAPAAAPRAVPQPGPGRDPRPHPGAGRARSATPPKRPWLDVDGEPTRCSVRSRCSAATTTADVVLDDPGVSRRHTEIRVTTRRPAPGREHPRPRLDQRHLRQQRADHQPAAERRRPASPSGGPADLPRGGR